MLIDLNESRTGNFATEEEAALLSRQGYACLAGLGCESVFIDLPVPV